MHLLKKEGIEMTEYKEWHEEPKEWRAKEWRSKKKLVQDDEDIYAEKPESKNKLSFLDNLLEEIKNTKGSTGLKTANNVARIFNRGIEKTGLPHAARGLVQGGEDVIRGIGNLIPGVNIPSAHFGEMPIGNDQENSWQKALGIGGEAAALANPATKIFQGSKTALGLLKNIPNIYKNILAGSSAGTILSPDNRGIGAGLGAIGSSIPEVGKLLKKTYKGIQRPYDLLRQTESQIGQLSREKQQSNALIKKAEQDVGRHLQSKNEANILDQQNLESKLSKVFPIKPKSETRAALAEQHEQSIKNLSNEFEKRYGNFSKEHGNTPIKATLPFEDFLHKTKDLKGLSSTIEEIRKNPSKKIIRYETSRGRLKEIPVPGKTATVDDYVSFMREIRDASYDALKASKNATYGEKQELLKTHGELKSLQDDVVDRIKDTIGNYNYKPFTEIQKDYSETVGRVKSEPSIANASYGKKISENLFSDLTQPANEKLRKYLYKQPGYKQALNEHLLQGPQHPISEGAQLNPTKINADIYHLLSNEQRAAKAEANIFGQKQESLKDVSKSIKSPEKMTALQDQEARKFSPEVNKFLDNIAKQKEITEKMTQEAEKLGLSKEKFHQQIQQRKLIATILATGAAVGIVPTFAKKLYHAMLG